MVAGVLGGLGRHLQIDPLVLRIVTVVLALFGGIGILLYAAAWLLLPAEDETASVADQALGRHETGSPRTATVALAFGLLLVVLTAFWGVVSGSWDGGVLLLLAACGIVMLLRRDRGDDDAVSARHAPVDDGGHDAASFPDYPGYPGYPGSASPSTGVQTDEERWWTEATDWQAGSAETWTDEPVLETPAAPPAPRSPRSALGRLTVSAAAATVGLIAINDAIWADVPAAIYAASALAVVGLGLLLGTWWGRSRGLIVLGIALAGALVPAVAFERLDWEAVDITVRPTTLAELPTGTQDYGAGSVEYDLSGLDFAGADETLSIDMGVGELLVILPPDVDVNLNADLGVGDLEAFGQTTEGFGRETRFTDVGDDGPGGGVLELDIDLGVGELEVLRAAP